MIVDANLPPANPEWEIPTPPNPAPEIPSSDPSNVPTPGSDVIFPGIGEPLGIPPFPGLDIPVAPPPVEVI